MRGVPALSFQEAASPPASPPLQKGGGLRALTGRTPTIPKPFTAHLINCPCRMSADIQSRSLLSCESRIPKLPFCVSEREP